MGSARYCSATEPKLGATGVPRKSGKSTEESTSWELLHVYMCWWLVMFFTAAVMLLSLSKLVSKW